MVDEEYKMQVAYKQVYAILSLYNQELLRLKLPQEVMETLKENSAKDYKYEVDPQNFDPNTLTEEASALLLIIFDKYFANDNQRKKIDKFLNPKKYEMYDYTLLFEKKASKRDEVKAIEESKTMIPYEQSFIKKIINKIKFVFNKRKK